MMSADDEETAKLAASDVDRDDASCRQQRGQELLLQVKDACLDSTSMRISLSHVGFAFWIWIMFTGALLWLHDPQATGTPPTSSLHGNRNGGETSSIPCWRQCPNGRINKIAYMMPQSAGLNDRITIMHTLMDMAGDLCAKLYFPGPAILLTSAYNGGVNVSPDMRWEDLLETKFYDGEEAVIDIPGALDELAYKKETKQFVRDVLHMSNKTKTWVPESDEHVWQEFLEARNYVESQAESEPLAFLIGHQFNSWRGHFRSDLIQWSENKNVSVTGSLPYRCNYRNQNGVAPLVKILAQNAWDQVLEDNPSIEHYGYLHIRRGDTKEECDTSLKKMETYFDCSLQNTISSYGSLGVAFSSDELDHAYRYAIEEMLHTRGHVPIDLDDLVNREIKRVVKPQLINNYLTFAVVKALAGGLKDVNMSFEMDLRRSDCPSCTNVMEQIGGSGH